MRPNYVQAGTSAHECFDCGTRFESPDSKICPDCDGELINLGRSRDL